MEDNFKKEEIDNTITVNGTELKVSYEGDVLINEKSIENIDECKQALAIIIKGICSMMNR